MSRFRWMSVLTLVAYSVGCTACSTTPKESARETPQQPSTLPCPVTETMCTMEYAPAHCVLKRGPEEIAAVDAENSCRAKSILNEKWCAISQGQAAKDKLPRVECTRSGE